jgi:hypothetical protein
MTFSWSLLIPIAAAVVFSPCLFTSFHFDDHSIFTDPIVLSSSGWWEVFRLERTRPLTYFTFWANLQITGRDYFGFHFVNLALHLLAVYWSGHIFRRLVGEKAAIAAMVVFSLHPIQTEAVTYIFARATLLATVMCLFCWWFWLQKKYWVSVIYFALALLSKEEAICFPIFILGVEYYVAKRSIRDLTVARAPLAMMGILALAAVLRLFYAIEATEGAGVGFGLNNLSAGTYLLVQPKVILEYLRLVIWPVGFNFDRDFLLPASWELPTLLVWGAFVLVLFLGLIYGHRIRGAYWVFGFFILILPTSSFIPLADVFAERRVYLPMVSLSLFLGLLLKNRLRVILPLVALLLGGLSFERVRTWKTEETLWRDTVKKSPLKVRPKLQLARALESTGPATTTERLALLMEARRLQPDDTTVMTEIGVFHLKMGHPVDAYQEFQAVLNIKPDDVQTLANQGAALYLLGNLDDARASFMKALSFEPCNFDARHNAILLERVLKHHVAVRKLQHTPRHCRFTPDQKSLLKPSGYFRLP